MSSSPTAVGKYRLILELARGGMGNVYLAVALGPAGFNKLFVVKELKPDLLQEQGFLEMFLDEARLAARLNHPNVVQTNEVNVDGGRAFLAMEYLEGQSLVRVRSRLTKTDRLPLDAHLRVLAEACRGLHYAHTLREFDGSPLHVVHRDVSPHNIFVTYDGQVKIVDFGVAKAVTSSHETGVGVMKGKLPYMAPEQVTGAPMDARVDVFAMGVCLWEAVANRRMWDQTRTETILGKLITGEIPKLVDVMPDAPPQLVEIVDRATAASPDARFPSAEALRVAIEGYLAQTRTGDPGVLRDLGATMMEAFAPERAQVDSAVAEQLRRLRQAPDGTATIDVVRLSASAAASYAAVTGPNPALGMSVSGAIPSGTAMMAHPSGTGSLPGASFAQAMPHGSHPGAAYATGSHPGASYPPAYQGGSLPGGGGDSGSGSRRYGNTSMALATAGSVMPPAAAKPAGSKSPLIALALLALSVAVFAAVVIGKKSRSRDEEPAGAAAAATAPAPAAVDTSTGTTTSTGNAAAPQVTDGAAASNDAASNVATSAGTKGATGAPGTKGNKGVTAAPVVPAQKPSPPAADPPAPAPAAPPRTTKPDLGY
ncbi:MAG: serine/threonine protein kinase [Deltaproteobacteria bacterium]|nr:serine/threonine protein kinase [Deltaproteobacteria bacterium]